MEPSEIKPVDAHARWIIRTA